MCGPRYQQLCAGGCCIKSVLHCPNPDATFRARPCLSFVTPAGPCLLALLLVSRRPAHGRNTAFSIGALQTSCDAVASEAAHNTRTTFELRAAVQALFDLISAPYQVMLNNADAIVTDWLACTDKYGCNAGPPTAGGGGGRGSGTRALPPSSAGSGTGRGSASSPASADALTVRVLLLVSMSCGLERRPGV